MKIQMENWLCFADRTIETKSHCAFVVGQNGIGKSGVRDAIEFALVGTCNIRAIERLGRPVNKKELATWVIRDDFEGCQVTFEANGIRIRRTMDREGKQEVFRATWGKVRINGAEADGWSDEDPMSLKRDQGNPFGKAPDDLVRCMLEPTHFYTLEPQRRQEILVQATSDPEVTEAAALEALKAALSPQNEDDETAITSAAGWVAKLGFRGAEESAKEQRVVAARARDLVVIGDEPEPLFPLEGRDEPIDLAERPVEEHEKMLASLRAKHTAAVQMESAGAGAMQGKLTEAVEALAEIEALPPIEPSDQLRNDLECRQSELAEASRPYVPKETEEPDRAARATAEARVTLQEDRIASDRESLAKVEEELAVLESTEPALPSDYPRPKICPKGPPGMKCPLGPKGFGQAVEKALGVVDPTTEAAKADRLRGKIVGSRELIGGEEEKLKEALREVQGFVDAQERFDRSARGLAAHDEVLARAGKAVAAAEDAVRDFAAESVKQRAEAIRTATERVEKARQAFEAARDGEKPTGPSAQDLEKTIGVGETVVEAAKDFWREVRARDARIIRRGELAAVWDRWDAICQQLKPTGIETKLGGAAREAFTAKLDESSGLAGLIQLDEACGILVDLGREGFYRQLLQLSTSQALAVGVAIQHALCQLEGFPILVVDSVDTFDREKLVAFAEMAVRIGKSYPGGLLGLATIKKEPPNAPKAPWQTHWLKPDGSLAVLGADGF